jgi:hypothetical protein
MLGACGSIFRDSSAATLGCFAKTFGVTYDLFIIISHIYREGNQCDDGIATLGLQIQAFQWWDMIPNSASHAFTRNRFGFPKYSFC